MLTKLTIRNFKRFSEVAIELGKTVVFVGPNNSGKTTALQALALWDIGVKRWYEKRAGRTTPEKRPGVTINRRDLIAIPVPDANLLWRDLHVRDVQRNDGKQQTQNIRVDVIVEGVTSGVSWSCGLEFDYANEESFYCRPLRRDDGATGERMIVPPQTRDVRVAFLPPMSGLASNETRLDPGAVNVRIGEGRTAEVLRNLCYRIISENDEGPRKWSELTASIHDLFGVSLDEPKYISERGEITMTYRDQSGVRLDLSSAGRGLQQTLLLLAHLVVNPRSVLLLDEPDAHLEILRQRQIYQLLTDSADTQQSQVIAASHSEVILNEAADRDVVIAFVGVPHRIDDRGTQAVKSLKEIGFEHYYQAEQKGWVLYLEGSTDLAILRAFARRLEHAAARALEQPFVYYVANQPPKARTHFFGIRDAKRDLVGIAIFDRLDMALQENDSLQEVMWQRREIENYLCTPETLVAFAKSSHQSLDIGPLFEAGFQSERVRVMTECITDLVAPAVLRDRSNPWWSDVKATDHFLDRVFEEFFKRLSLPNLMRKTDYHVLASHVPGNELSPEVSSVLDAIAATAAKANPAGGVEQ
jgi:energy-coupling factor transporter ATP-binding protein EcfA2